MKSTSAGRALSENLRNPDLFKAGTPGQYTYGETAYGKSASGILELKNGTRDPKAQQLAGGVDRTARDDGGHLIANRFNGDPGERNLEAQDRSLNRGAYKHRENEWAKAIQSNDKVYVNVETYHPEGSQRPDAFMGYQIVEHPDGTREWEAFSYQNQSPEEMAEQDRIVREQNELINEYDNPMGYRPEDYAEELAEDWDYDAAAGSGKPATAPEESQGQDQGQSQIPEEANEAAPEGVAARALDTAAEPSQAPEAQAAAQTAQGAQQAAAAAQGLEADTGYDYDYDYGYGY